MEKKRIEKKVNEKKAKTNYYYRYKFYIIKITTIILILGF